MEADNLCYCAVCCVLCERSGNDGGGGGGVGQFNIERYIQCKVFPGSQSSKS